MPIINILLSGSSAEKLFEAFSNVVKDFFLGYSLIFADVLQNSCFKRFLKFHSVPHISLISQKHLYWSLFFNKVAGQAFRPATLLKIDSNTGVFL